MSNFPTQSHGNNYRPILNANALRNLLRILFKQKSTILIVSLAIAALFFVVAVLMPPTYRATAALMIERNDQSQKALMFRMDLRSYYDNVNWLNSEIETIKSYPVALGAIQEIGPGLFQRNKANASADSSIELENLAMRFLNELKVNNIKNSNIVTLSYESRDRELAKQAVNQVIDVYRKFRSDLGRNTDEYAFLEDQLAFVGQQLDTLEKKQSKFREEQQLISPDTQKDIILERLADYEKKLTAVRARRMVKAAQLQVIRKQLERTAALSIPATESSDSPSREEYIGKLKGDLLNLELQRANLLEKFTPEYEEVIILDKQIETTREKIRTEIEQILELEEVAIRTLSAEEQVYINAIENTQDELRKLSTTEKDFSQLSRGVTDNQEIFSLLFKQKEEARITLNNSESDIKIRVITPATSQPGPVKPKRNIMVAFGILIGFLSGITLAFLREYFHRTIDTPIQLEELSHLPVFGYVKNISWSELAKHYLLQTINPKEAKS